MDFTARSRSASGMMMTGALPPSSRLTFVMFFAASSMTREPVLMLPVTLTMPISGFEASSSPTTGP